MACIIVLPCVDAMDRACVDECLVDYIYEGERTFHIRPGECVDHGTCESVRPVEAIYYEDNLPEEWSMFEPVNAEFFDDIGSPGGAQHLEPTDNDHLCVAGSPPQGE